MLAERALHRHTAASLFALSLIWAGVAGVSAGPAKNPGVNIPEEYLPDGEDMIDMFESYEFTRDEINAYMDKGKIPTDVLAQMLDENYFNEDASLDILGHLAENGHFGGDGKDTPTEAQKPGGNTAPDTAQKQSSDQQDASQSGKKPDSDKVPQIRGQAVRDLPFDQKARPAAQDSANQTASGGNTRPATGRAARAGAAGNSAAESNSSGASSGYNASPLVKDTSIRRRERKRQRRAMGNAKAMASRLKKNFQPGHFKQTEGGAKRAFQTDSPGRAEVDGFSPADPKSKLDLARAHAVGYKPAFDKLGLTVGRNGKSVIRQDGSPADAPQLARLSEEIRAMPKALSRYPRFLSNISLKAHRGLKAKYLQSPRLRESSFRHIALSENNRDFIWERSCEKVSGDCNRHVRSASYEKEELVAPSDLKRILDSIPEADDVDKMILAHGAKARNARLKLSGGSLLGRILNRIKTAVSKETLDSATAYPGAMEAMGDAGQPAQADWEDFVEVIPEETDFPEDGSAAGEKPAPGPVRTASTGLQRGSTGTAALLACAIGGLFIFLLTVWKRREET